MAEIAIFADTKMAEEWLGKLEKKVKEVDDGHRKFAGVLTAVVFQDIVDHFQTEEGSKGPWEEWSDSYRAQMEERGRGGNQILQDSGHLRQAFTPGNYRSVPQGILWFNPAKTKGGFAYAAAHDEGGDELPTRDFMWLSDTAHSKIEKLTLDYILGD
jgi:phage gpG-like protein